MDHAIHQSPNGSSGHETRDTGVALIALSAAGLAVVILIVFLLMWGTFNLLKNDQQANDVSLSPLAPAVQIPPQPRLQEHPAEELRQLRERENKELTTYGWQDQKAGIVRIPIDRAMDILAQKGFPSQFPGQPPGVAKPAPAAKLPAKPVAPAGAPHAQ
jgi:hypothetical protein